MLEEIAKLHRMEFAAGVKIAIIIPRGAWIKLPEEMSYTLAIGREFA